MSTQLTEEKKQAATDALKEGLKAGFEATKGKTLTWWERALWVIVAGIAAAASSYLTGCTLSVAKQPDGTFLLLGSMVQPVTVQEGK